jgi:hypothetical protein
MHNVYNDELHLPTHIEAPYHSSVEVPLQWNPAFGLGIRGKNTSHVQTSKQ